MATSVQTYELKSKKPFVVLPLEQYESLLEYIEDLEDLADIQQRSHEKNIPWAETDKKFKKKFGVK